VSAYIGTGKGRRIYLGAGCCCSCCLGSHHAKVVGSLLFSSLSHEKIGGGGGGRIDVTSKDAGEQLAIVGIELY
jgi:hypothetical protein